MPFAIEWVERCDAPTRHIAVETPAGPLFLTLQGDVVVDANWRIDTDADLSDASRWQKLFDRYWNDWNTNIQIQLWLQGTPYRRRVWAELCRIPFGETRTYAALATTLGSSPRAVGNACRDNPYAPIIPCHRVVSSSGLGGYCGVTEGALMDVKIKLLRFEAEHRR
jgi:methylated-DNA-[protein]-cysteine S-methyltransferase